MNAPERIANAALGVLGTLSICYAPLIDKKRKALGTRLTMLATNPNDRPPIGQVLEALNTVWPESRAPVLVAPLDAEFDESALDWDPPSNAILEIPTAALRDPRTQTVAQALFRDGKPSRGGPAACAAVVLRVHPDTHQR
jgi:hypothetical protein